MVVFFLLGVHEALLVSVVRHETALSLVDLAKMNHKQVYYILNWLYIHLHVRYCSWSFSWIGSSFCSSCNYNYHCDFGIHKVRLKLLSIKSTTGSIDMLNQGRKPALLTLNK